MKQRQSLADRVAGLELPALSAEQADRFHSTAQPEVALAGSSADLHLPTISAEKADELERELDVQRRAKDVGMLGSLARGALQGVTLGAADEIAAFASSALSSRSYKEALEESRRRFAAAEKANPVTYIAGDVAGSIGTIFVPGLGWLNASTRTAAAGARVGALGGAASGFLRGEGGATERAQMAAVGGVLGGASGAAIGGVMQAISRKGLGEKASRTAAVVGVRQAQAGRPLPKKGMDAFTDLLSADEVANSAYEMGIAAQRAGLNKMPKALIRLKPGQTLTDDDVMKAQIDALPSDFINLRIGRPLDAPVDQKATDEFTALWASMNKQAREDMWGNYNYYLGVTDGIEEASLTRIRRDLGDLDATRADGLLHKWGLGKLSGLAASLMDPQLKFRQVDRVMEKMGVSINMEGTYSNLARGLREAQISKASLDDLTHKANKTIARAYGKRNTTTEDRQRVGRMVLGLEQPTSDADRAAVAAHKKLSADAREMLNSMGLNIKEQDNYLFSIAVSPAEAARRVRALIKKEGIGSSKVTEALDYIDGKGLAPSADRPDYTPANVERILRDSLEVTETTKGRSLSGPIAKSARERIGEVPEALREMDYYVVQLAYNAVNTRAATLARPIAEMQTNIAIMRGLGMENSANYATEFARSVAGETGVGAAYLGTAINRMTNSMNKILDDETAGTMKKGAALFGKSANDILSLAVTSAYPSMLGFNVHAPLRNTLQTWLLTAPEINWTSGLKHVGKAWLGYLRKPIGLDAMKKDLGRISAYSDMTFAEAPLDAVEAGLREVPEIMRLGQRGVQRVGQIGMYAYSGSDVFNRYMTLETSRSVVRSMLSGKADDGTRKFLQSLPAGIRGDLRRIAVAGGDNVEEALSDRLGIYLIDKTQFNYGKAGLSRFGQEYGRVVSMFLKWPQMVISDVGELIETGQSMKAFSRYAAPMALVVGAQMAREQMDDLDTPVARAALGRSLYNHAPGTSILAPFGGGNPIISTGASGGKLINDLYKATSVEDVEASFGRMWKQSKPFVPFVGPASKLYDTINYIGGE